MEQPNPGNGLFQMTYGYSNGSAHITCDNDCNVGWPTEDIHYEGNNWVYKATFRNGKSTNSEVTFTTKAYL